MLPDLTEMERVPAAMLRGFPMVSWTCGRNCRIERAVRVATGSMTAKWCNPGRSMIQGL